ncbi:cAMP-dependent protein kinase [Ranunculus cassubicifolius]
MGEIENHDHHQCKQLQQERKILLGKYEIGRLLGQGTFAKVYYGKHLKSGESVAIKVINIEQVKKQGMMEQIEREISVMHLVHHPNIVQLKEVMATKGKIFFVMEYVRGGELFAQVYKGKLKETVARKYFQQLISAVDYCHSRGITHRDLKPENLLLDDNGDLKISDFGLSALSEQRRSDGLLHTRCGTPAYGAPEVLRKKGYNGAGADIWSCGVILYVLLAGFLPFQDENVMKMYMKVFRAKFDFPPWFSSDAIALISKLLVADPDKRIKISEIMQDPWFKKPAISIASTSDSQLPILINERNDPKSQWCSSPPSFNAFELISSMASGLDLSNLFEKKRKCCPFTFTSESSASIIISRLESMAKNLRFEIDETKEFKVQMQGKDEGRKGKLSVVAEIHEVAPAVAVVEFTKSTGDTIEYDKFCEEARPALADIVWSWQGDATVKPL